MDLIRKTNFQTQNYKVTEKIYWHYETLNEILLQLYIVGLSSEKNNTNVSPYDVSEKKKKKCICWFNTIQFNYN
jgi:hypothetical protein